MPYRYLQFISFKEAQRLTNNFDDIYNVIKTSNRYNNISILAWNFVQNPYMYQIWWRLLITKVLPEVDTMMYEYMNNKK